MTEELHIGDRKIVLTKGDILSQSADALVTAANRSLEGGGGVDGAIHRAAGPRLLAACSELGGCPTGSAVMTGGFDLETKGVRYVIHAVGPVWMGGRDGEEEQLQSAYRTALHIADDAGVMSIAFPSISTGSYGYPVEPAARTAIRAVAKYLRDEARSISLATFVLYDTRTYTAFDNALILGAR